MHVMYACIYLLYSLLSGFMINAMFSSEIIVFFLFFSHCNYYDSVFMYVICMYACMYAFVYFYRK